jgi:hypothetical protein
MLHSTNAQTNNVGIGTSTPDVSALLEVKSTNQGFLPPRMSQNSVFNIPSPAEGLMLYNTTSKMPNIYNGTDWVEMEGAFAAVQQRLDNGETPKQIFDSGIPLTLIYGKTYQGGFIAYLNTSTGTGLIVSKNDLGVEVDWQCSGDNTTGANGTAIGTGQQNTLDILTNSCSSTNLAARLCDNYSVSINGTTYSDWFLPSKDELFQVFINLKAHDHGNFVNDRIYWSSSEFSQEVAWIQRFFDGFQYLLLAYPSPSSIQNEIASVRAVRAF